MRMMAAAGAGLGLARALGAPSPSARHLIPAALAGLAGHRGAGSGIKVSGRRGAVRPEDCAGKNNAGRAFFATTPGEHKSSPKDNKSSSDSGTIKFSTSKASYRVWTVDKSLGSDYQNPWWKVLPLSLVGIAFLVWCFLREESDVDKILEQTLLDHLPAFKQTVAEPEEDTKEPSKGT
uniref:ubiquinol-cytochrome c reductase complex assembly factor 4 n=1 Tax=Pristiophorus japonicus TaxID=55135 RepID=UPI00398EE77F